MEMFEISTIQGQRKPDGEVFSIQWHIPSSIKNEVEKCLKKLLYCIRRRSSYIIVANHIPSVDFQNLPHPKTTHLHTAVTSSPHDIILRKIIKKTTSHSFLQIN